MSKTKLLLNAVSSLRSLADDLEALCNCIVQGESASVAVTAEGLAQSAESSGVPAAESSSPPSRAEKKQASDEFIDPESGEIIKVDLPAIRTLASQKTESKELKGKVKALLTKYSVTRLTDLPPSEYLSFYKEVRAIV